MRLTKLLLEHSMRCKALLFCAGNGNCRRNKVQACGPSAKTPVALDRRLTASIPRMLHLLGLLYPGVTGGKLVSSAFAVRAQVIELR
jgi:hypothetical protein